MGFMGRLIVVLKRDDGLTVVCGRMPTRLDLRQDPRRCSLLLIQFQSTPRGFRRPSRGLQSSPDPVKTRLSVLM